MNEVTLFEVVTMATALVGIYVKMQQEVGKLKARIQVIESERDEFRATLKELLNAVQELKIMLAKKGISE